MGLPALKVVKPVSEVRWAQELGMHLLHEQYDAAVLYDSCLPLQPIVR
jgi:hypothetical protein